jgi:hypothetical protein
MPTSNYYSWKDISALTFNGVDLRQYIIGIAGLKLSATTQTWQPAGSVWPNETDTGMRVQTDIVIDFQYSGDVAGPAQTCPLGTTAALNIAYATNQSVSGSFLVSDWDFPIDNKSIDPIKITFKPSGAITWDVTA